MTAIWVDTDFGFDDLWALLVLRRLNVRVDGISLVAGNASMGQVVKNALGAALAYGFDTPIWRGSQEPLERELETAGRILGPTGMRSRGRTLPDPVGQVQHGAVTALQDWLVGGTEEQSRDILALGPLTNIARLIQSAPEAARRITRLVWMGGGNGAGNHTRYAEFNAWADPDAARIVANAGLPLDIVDLTLCRTVVFGPDDLPVTDPLTADLLGGYLDIALERGRPAMAIYDPTAAFALADEHHLHFEPRALSVTTEPGDRYGETTFVPDSGSRTRLAIDASPQLAAMCLSALAGEV
ncbi:nucleoside hydrolase [Hoeflea poritis]|uniref:Nucleoside hydrolase n=1 Tax=Hoeflea poritis TaxID=2993659 RepID=A0ABT4VS67_9HYPH|nr:nucleoside hydrolase [Hoeflea poritis]MDA4847557.1 nucleoside hydrolase [Hoeflea poritis]